MSGRIFVDTNIFVYAFDGNEPTKQRRSWEILKQAREEQIVVSTQVLQEFYTVVTRKLEKPLDEEQAESAVRRMVMLPVVQVDAPMVLSAIGASRTLRISFWDALIVRAAIEGDCEKLLTEDLQHDQRIDSLRVENPFLPIS
jgi:predicted nucleic acid-binding protein